MSQSESLLLPKIKELFVKRSQLEVGKDQEVSRKLENVRRIMETARKAASEFLKIAALNPSETPLELVIRKGNLTKNRGCTLEIKVGNNFSELNLRNELKQLMASGVLRVSFTTNELVDVEFTLDTYSGFTSNGLGIGFLASVDHQVPILMKQLRKQNPQIPSGFLLRVRASDGSQPYKWTSNAILAIGGWTQQKNKTVFTRDYFFP